MFKILISALLLILTSGCAYNASVDIAPAFNVYTNYDVKLPGHFALYIDAGDMEQVANVDGYACSAHNYPVDASSQFAMSVLRTFEGLVESIEIVDFMLSSESLAAREYTAILKVEVRELDIDLTIIPGFWTNKADADISISASIEAFDKNGRLLGSTIEGDGDAQNETGAFCDGVSKALSKAMSIAMKETMQRLGERLANSRQMRDGQ